mgnify:CR=1 FL=1
MDDIEKNRVVYVQQIETKLSHLQTENEKHKLLAEKWEPKLTTKVDVDTGKVIFGLQFGGKFAQVSVSQHYLVQMDATTATSEICETLITSLVAPELRKVFAPEVERHQRGAQATAKAGKW